MAEKSYDISRLLDFYGEMLSQRQQTAVRLYYNDDLSLSEISEELGISRQGVRASLVKSEKILRDMEEKLGFAARFDRTMAEVGKLREFAEITSINSGDEKLRQFAERIIGFTKSIEQKID